MNRGGREEDEVVGQCDSRSQGEGTVGGGSLWTSGMEEIIIPHRSYIKVLAKDDDKKKTL